MAEIATGAGAQQLPLICSKLQAPVSRTRVSRPQLLDVLRGPPRKLTLIRAPAGWGKSTLLADWQASDGEGRPFAWLALDEQDNDPVRFWTYAIEALHTALPALGDSSRVLTQTPDAARARDDPARRDRAGMRARAPRAKAPRGTGPPRPRRRAPRPRPGLLHDGRPAVVRPPACCSSPPGSRSPPASRATDESWHGPVERNWTALLTVVLAAFYIFLGATALGPAGLLGIAGGLLAAGLVARRGRIPVPLGAALLLAAALPFATLTWWSVATPLLGLLLLLAVGASALLRPRCCASSATA